MNIESTTITAKRCKCDSNYCVDRLINGKDGCPACDPELGSTVEGRIESYRKLISPSNVFIKNRNVND